MSAPTRRRFVLAASVVLALAVAGCAANAPPPSSIAGHQAVDQKKQTELDKMEQAGQRNDDSVPLK